VIVDIWPENAESFLFFCAMSTQWRAGASGIIGLDYAATQSVREARQVAAADWPAIFEDLRTMELAAIPVINGA